MAVTRSGSISVARHDLVGDRLAGRDDERPAPQRPRHLLRGTSPRWRRRCAGTARRTGHGSSPRPGSSAAAGRRSSWHGRRPTARRAARRGSHRCPSSARRAGSGCGRCRHRAGPGRSGRSRPPGRERRHHHLGCVRAGEQSPQQLVGVAPDSRAITDEGHRIHGDAHHVRPTKRKPSPGGAHRGERRRPLGRKPHRLARGEVRVPVGVAAKLLTPVVVQPRELAPLRRPSAGVELVQRGVRCPDDAAPGAPHPQAVVDVAVRRGEVARGARRARRTRRVE